MSISKEAELYKKVVANYHPQIVLKNSKINSIKEAFVFIARILNCYKRLEISFPTTRTHSKVDRKIKSQHFIA